MYDGILYAGCITLILQAIFLIEPCRSCLPDAIEPCRSRLPDAIEPFRSRLPDALLSVLVRLLYELGDLGRVGTPATMDALKPLPHHSHILGGGGGGGGGRGRRDRLV